MLGVIPTGSVSARNCRGNRETPVQNNSHGATFRTLVSFTELGEMEEKGWKRERERKAKIHGYILRWAGFPTVRRLHGSILRWTGLTTIRRLLGSTLIDRLHYREDTAGAGVIGTPKRGSDLKRELLLSSYGT